MIMMMMMIALNIITAKVRSNRCLILGANWTILRFSVAGHVPLRPGDSSCNNYGHTYITYCHNNNNNDNDHDNSNSNIDNDNDNDNDNKDYHNSNLVPFLISV